MIESQQTDFFLSLVVVVVGGGSDDGDVKWWSLAFPGGRRGFSILYTVCDYYRLLGFWPETWEN